MNAIPLQDPILTFDEALAATGAEKAWLRTLLQRDKSRTIGTKHRTGRLLFSMLDIAAISVMWSLNARLHMAPSAAWEVLSAFSWILRKSEETETIRFAFDAANELLVWSVDADGVVVAWNDRAADNLNATIEANNWAHIAVPIESILRPMAEAGRLAQKGTNGGSESA